MGKLRDLRGRHVRLEPIRAEDRDRFLQVTRRSRDFHRPWVWPPTGPRTFDEWLREGQATHRERYLVWSREADDLLGYVAVNEIVYGAFQSGYLGYWVSADQRMRGRMGEALSILIRHLFTRRRLRLHRLEANIQPGNAPSIALVRSLGFQLEGLSPRYLRIGGRWRDHERWALTEEDWRVRARGSEEGA